MHTNGTTETFSFILYIQRKISNVNNSRLSKAIHSSVAQLWMALDGAKGHWIFRALSPQLDPSVIFAGGVVNGVFVCNAWCVVGTYRIQCPHTSVTPGFKFWAKAPPLVFGFGAKYLYLDCTIAHSTAGLCAGGKKNPSLYSLTMTYHGWGRIQCVMCLFS